MRVTTVIRDYVRKQVNDIYAVKKENVCKDYETRRDTLINKCQKEVDKLNKKLMAMVTEEGFAVRYGGECVVQLNGIVNQKEEDKQRQLNWDLDNERDAKITEILASLELGATKEELDEMLKELKKSIK